MEIVFATGNANKLAEAQRVLGERFHLVMPSELDLTGAPETHETLYENAVEKALFIWNKFQKTALPMTPDSRWTLLGEHPEYIPHAMPANPNLLLTI